MSHLKSWFPPLQRGERGGGETVWKGSINIKHKSQFLNWKFCRFLFFWLALLHSVSYLFLLYWSPSSSLCTVFDSISSNIGEVVSINPSANVFVFGDHQKDWLTYSGGTDQHGEVCFNFSISNDLTRMAHFPTQIPDCDSHSPALLNLFLCSDTSMCSTLAFPPLGNSDHVVNNNGSIDVKMDGSVLEEK